MVEGSPAPRNLHRPGHDADSLTHKLGGTKWTRKPLQATIVTPKQALTIGGGTLRS
jgi:hypothetical protein